MVSSELEHHPAAIPDHEVHRYGVQQLPLFAKVRPLTTIATSLTNPAASHELRRARMQLRADAIYIGYRSSWQAAWQAVWAKPALRHWSVLRFCSRSVPPSTSIRQFAQANPATGRR